MRRTTKRSPVHKVKPFPIPRSSQKRYNRPPEPEIQKFIANANSAAVQRFQTASTLANKLLK